MGLAPPARAATNTFDCAPFYSRDTDVNGDTRRRMLGPFFESRAAVDGKSLWAVHPLISTIRDPSDQRSESDVVWPLLVSKCHREFWQWRLAVLGLWRDFDVTDPDSRYSLWFLPVYFQGRDQDHKPYFAIFPLGGKISDILVWDELWFALFPLYAHARVNDIDTYSYLWPIMATSRGMNVPVERAYVFPFYGYSSRQDDFDKHFILWPFWTSSRYYYPRSHGYGWILFPLLGHVKLSDQETWMFLPPFSRFSKSTKMTQINCPWPIFQYSSGKIEKLYFWPVVGYKVIGDTQTGFLFWPIGISAKRLTPQGVNQRYYMVPIVYSETLTRRKRAGAAAGQGSGEAQSGVEVALRALKVWPLFSYRRVGDNSRFGFPSLCPYKDYEVIERNYAPLWTLYSHSASGDVKEDELLWGLVQYRRSSAGLLKTSVFPLFSVERQKSGADVEWSFLKGLVGREREGDRMRMRLLYFFKW